MLIQRNTKFAEPLPKSTTFGIPIYNCIVGSSCVTLTILLQDIYFLAVKTNALFLSLLHGEVITTYLMERRLSTGLELN